jgi:hypothetical protein
MSEALLHDISWKLRLLARQHCVTDSSGRLLRGAIDYGLELIRGGVNDALDHLQDYGRLSPVDEACVAIATRVVGENRPIIRALQRELDQRDA